MRKPWRPELVPACAMLAALAVLCSIAARWTWVVLLPAVARPPPPRETIDLRAELDPTAAARLFASRAEDREQAIPPTPLNVKLLGVFAARGGAQSYAVLNLDSRGGELIPEGSELAAGIVLHAVHADHVLIRRQGIVERVEFPGTAGTSVAGRSFNIDVQRTGTDQYAFSRSSLNQALQRPDQLAQLGALALASGSGVRISQAPPGSLAQKLSLKAGDLIQLVNGQAVATQADLARLYEQFATTRHITLEGVRDGAPLRLTYTVQP